MAISNGTIGVTVTKQDTLATDSVIADSLFRISVERYHRMVDSGVLTEDDAVELLEGWIVNKMPKNRPHVIITNLVRQALEMIISEAFHVESESAITLTSSEPEPDVMVIRGHLLDYEEHPTADDVVLLVEVANTSLQRDQNRKKQIYASEQIPVYWIVNLPDEQIEVYCEPSGVSRLPNYGQLQTYRRGDDVPVEVDGQIIGRIPVNTLLP